MGIVLVEFKTERIETYGDGYIHNVSNPMSPVPAEFKVIVQYDLDGPYEYDIIISKSPYKWAFVDSRWLLSPTFHIPEYNIQHNRLYIMTDRGSFPLINPGTGLPSFHTRETEEGTDVTFLNIYRRYETLEVRSVPYPMRSVYVQRRIPSHGFMDLKGKLNKPLNKKYFEFWMNGKLLHDEVTIISPTKLILHGLRSLRNFEIIEVNRDPNEYFSDIFLEAKELGHRGRLINSWNYDTYLDAALEGKLEGDNYTLEEQRYLLSPVWDQVGPDHPSFKDYPPNVDSEDDIIQRIHIPDDFPVDGLDEGLYQFLIIDAPTLEGTPLTGRRMRFDQFGFQPISDEKVVEMLNKEWHDEIAKDPYVFPHIVIGEQEWHGISARLYDSYGIQVHNLNEAAYILSDPNTLHINTKRRSGRILRNQVTYDLS